MNIELSGEDPFLLSGLAFTEPEDTSRVLIDLSNVRLADPLTVLGAALIAYRAAFGGATPRLAVSDDDAEIESLTVLGLFDLEEPWCRVFRPSRRRARASHCVPLCRLDCQGGRGDFVTRCLELLGRQERDPRLLWAIGQVLVELVDNAVVHSRSRVGTYGVARAYTAGDVEGPVVEVAVGDAGVGIAGTLGALHLWLAAEPVDALREAFKPRVSGMPPGGLHFGLGLHLVRQIIRRRIPASELAILSGDACGRVRADHPRDRYGPRGNGCDVARQEFRRWGTWTRLRVPLGT